VQQKRKHKLGYNQRKKLETEDLKRILSMNLFSVETCKLRLTPLKYKFTKPWIHIFEISSI